MKKTIGLLLLLFTCLTALPAFAESAHVQLTSLSLNRSSGTILAGKTAQLKIADYSPRNATASTRPVWESSDTNIVLVTQQGWIRAINAGSATISCTADGVSASCRVTVESKADLYRAEVVSLVNELRAHRGIAPLKYNYALQAAADVRAQEIISRFAHNRPDGSFYSSVLPPEYKVNSGENIAAGYTSPRSAVKGWLKSGSHRDNLLRTIFKETGVGLAMSGGKIYWVQLFWG